MGVDFSVFNVRPLKGFGVAERSSSHKVGAWDEDGEAAAASSFSECERIAELQLEWVKEGGSNQPRAMLCAS